MVGLCENADEPSGGFIKFSASSLQAEEILRLSTRTVLHEISYIHRNCSLQYVTEFEKFIKEVS
jgi:hypothetical protein